jgi:hypothetical protein
MYTNFCQLIFFIKGKRKKEKSMGRMEGNFPGERKTTGESFMDTGIHKE